MMDVTGTERGAQDEDGGYQRWRSERGCAEVHDENIDNTTDV